MEKFKNKKGELILEELKKEDWVILLDEKGKSFDSIGLQYINLKRSNALRRMVFVIGILRFF